MTTRGIAHFLPRTTNVRSHLAHFRAHPRVAHVALALALTLVACDGSTTDDPTELEPDAAPVECPAPEMPAWRGVECRVLCGSVELGAPALCPGATSFADCHRECWTGQPAGNYCPLTPAGGAR